MRIYKTDSGSNIKRLSRWIKIKQAYNVTTRHCLSYYRTDENGYREGQANFNPENGTFLDYFEFQGKKYALNQFICLNSMWAYPVMYYDENGYLNALSGYDSENYYNPIMIELSECGEYVRCYRET